MNITVGLFPFDRWGGHEQLAEAVVLAEEVGVDAVALPEHLVMPRRPGAAPVGTVWYENFVLAAHLAARTSRIGFVFSAFVVPYRQPVLAAKTIATLDVVSGGRVTIVAGVGWLRREFAALGVPYEERGQMTDEHLMAMKELWTAQRPRFEGRYTRFAELEFRPRCVQRPHVPVLIGGNGPRARRRAIELGDGWAPMPLPHDELAQGIDAVRRGVAARGRPVGGLRFTGGVTIGTRDVAIQAALEHVAGDDQGDAVVPPDPDAIAAAASRQAAIGVTDFRLGFSWHQPRDFLRSLEWLGDRVLGPVRSAVTTGAPGA